MLLRITYSVFINRPQSSSMMIGGALRLRRALPLRSLPKIITSGAPPFSETATIPPLIPSFYTSFRFLLKCNRYPLCTQKFGTVKKQEKHIKSEICVPLGERKNSQKKNSTDSTSGDDSSDGDLQNSTDGDDSSRVEDSTFLQDSTAEEDSSTGELPVVVRKVIELHDKYMEYVSTCSMNHSLFNKALKEAFELFCNKGVAVGSSAELLLATFCDNILKKGGSEKLSDRAIEATLEKVVKLLAFVSYKDLYAEFYRKELARRLLFDQSAYDDHARSFLSQLKQQRGGQFTSKMEGMIQDADKDRMYAIDASIVQIMKSRKVLGHRQLVMECAEQLSRMFKADFKKRIKDLFTGDCLERDKDNPNLFRYLA